MPEHTNALALETSPYLLQHAHNPVDWRPWGPEAIAEAQRTRRLMLISIGYAACHWCHVMERESFEDEEVAAAMNADYVCVKVDREERPDVDDIYMAACQLSGGGGCGWPLNAVALPDGRPVWAGTYFPKRRWLDVLSTFVSLRQNEPQKLEAYARQIAEQLEPEAPLATTPLPHTLDPRLGVRNAEHITQLADPEHGGFGGAPKFPLPVGYAFLLDHLALTQGSDAQFSAVGAVIEAGLLGMARGGIFDQIGGGFSRYSVDARWHAPHFEKMLYDNAQLVSVYSRAYRDADRHKVTPPAGTVAPRDEYGDAIQSTLTFVERELTSPEGLFYSSLDADSEGVEGKYYVWTYDELLDLLSPEEVAILAAVYGLRPEGNWEDDTNIFHRQGSWTEAVITLAPPLNANAGTLTPLRLRREMHGLTWFLQQARNMRVRPALDDKILMSWNAMMVTGYVDAYLALRDPAYLATAQRAARALLSGFRQNDGRLLRTSAKGRTHVNAFLDDYANLAEACLRLYDVTFDEDWLRAAQGLVDYALLHFSAPDRALLYYTSEEDVGLVTRRFETDDNVTPASNSVLADVLFTLGTTLAEGRYLVRAKAMLAEMMPVLEAGRQSLYASRWLQLHERLSYSHYELAIVGPNAAEARLKLAKYRLPQATLIGTATGSDLELLRGKFREGQTLYYVCREGACGAPSEDLAEILGQVGVKI